MKKIYYVAKCYGTRTLPAIFEVFDDYADAQSYATPYESSQRRGLYGS